jgi:RNA polymerase sigma-70 factor (ECF subfamily)
MMGAAPPTTAFDLAARARAGDADAFRSLFERYHQRLALLVHYRIAPPLRGRVEVDDVLQETFLAAVRDLAQFDYRSPGSFFRWLAGIALHTLADMARHAGRERRDAACETPLSGVVARDSLTPSRILFQRERMQALLARLDALPEHYREVVLLAKLEGLTTAEAAARLGKTREQTALLLHRALAAVRAGGPL